MNHSDLILPEDPDPNITQQRAAIPEHDVWVAASAGSGKTKVLTDRVLRLLLPDPLGRWQGAAPHKILCITFTKAAAALMALRVQKKLGEWAIMDDSQLAKDLTKLLGASPDEHLLKAARQLFSRVLDVPGGLSIMTIHAFCQSTLGRFAIEAGVTPGFTVIEEARAHEVLRHIIDNFIKDIETGKFQNIRSSYDRIATYLDLDSLRDTILQAMAKSREVNEFISAAQKNGGLFSSVLAQLNYDPKRELELAEDDLLYIARLLVDQGGKRESESGQKIANWLALPAAERIEKLEMIEGAFLSKAEKTLRKVSKNINDNHAEFFVMRDAILKEISEFQDNQAKKHQAEQTADLFQIVAICMQQYVMRKRELNALDFNDLILKTRLLLENQRLDWVQYKLDEGIDHILVDEAQDTNIHQWEIIRHLSDDFLAGDGNKDRQRSLFVVGDEKQSIFSFHGADPDAFFKMRDYFHQRSTAAERYFDPVMLETSFRSARPVLQLVDAVFECPDVAGRIGILSQKKLTHYSYRPKAAGLVEIWAPMIREKVNTRDKTIEWVLPPVSRDATQQGEEIAMSSPLAHKIAFTISSWLQKKEILESENRPIEPRDILILVRTRTGFVPDVVRQLKTLGVPVSGVDRMKLADQIAVSDCLVLAKFARCPEDDLSLACLLRSPFVRITEDELMKLALGRDGSLWAAAQKSLPLSTIAWLQKAILRSRTEKPFDFFDDILNSPCPYDGHASGWQAFSTCLGMDCLDPLDEFLSYCLHQESDGVFSLEELIALLGASDIVIKRDAEGGEKGSLNQVRIMTVHASKGLEAPIVLLPDTMSVPNRGKIDALQWIEGDDAYFKKGIKIPLWSARSSEGCRDYQTSKEMSYDRMISEHMRLLYVALTRPRDRLYVMGESRTETCPEFSWYQLVAEAFDKLPYQESRNGKVYKTDQLDREEQAKRPPIEAKSDVILPSWASRPALQDQIPQTRIIQPSRLASDEDIVRSPLDSVGDHRFKRGILTHKLFQLLPELPPGRREQAATQFLSRMGAELSEDIRTDIVKETLTILNDPIFADVFGEKSLSEVPVSGDLGDGRMISGQIDRLVIGHKRILIIDFKTNRPSPRTETDIPKAYKEQLKAYKTALSLIFPDREIVCGLLWTDQPLLMPVSV